MLLTMLAAGLLGAMIMFNVVVAPVVFTQLGQQEAGRFLRSVFPRLFIFGLVVAMVLTAMAVWLAAPTIALLGGLIALGFGLNTWVITPRVNVARDNSLNGSGSEREFHLLHLASVGVFVAQAGGLVAILWLA